MISPMQKTRTESRNQVIKTECIVYSGMVHMVQNTFNKLMLNCIRFMILIN